VTYEILEVTESTGIARWSASFTRIPYRQQAKLEGILMASFDANSSQAHAFKEWWHSQDSRPDRRVALITGASRGLGAVVAHFVAGQNYDLVITARGAEALATAASGLERFGGTVITLPGDIADAAHRARLVEAVLPSGGSDSLFNNASDLGLSPMPALADYPLDVLSRVMNVNVFAPVGLIQQTLPLLKTAQGLVVNISSDAAVGGMKLGWYGASKAALDLISLTLANELREAGVGVVSVDPGDMRTVMHQQAFPGEDISDRPEPEVTLPFWGWLLGQEVLTVSGQRYRAQAEQWEVAV
jgi:NAD(P)-dependent dehydrogenase (short-subunit alcohol dehydrogenase family)